VGQNGGKERWKKLIFCFSYLLRPRFASPLPRGSCGEGSRVWKGESNKKYFNNKNQVPKGDLFFFSSDFHSPIQRPLAFLPPSLLRGIKEGGRASEKRGLLESGCLIVQPKMGGKFHLKLNITRDTDIIQVPRGKDEKNSE